MELQPVDRTMELERYKPGLVPVDIAVQHRTMVLEHCKRAGPAVARNLAVPVVRIVEERHRMMTVEIHKIAELVESIEWVRELRDDRDDDRDGEHRHVIGQQLADVLDERNRLLVLDRWIVMFYQTV
jgi:hypothetical protein